MPLLPVLAVLALGGAAAWGVYESYKAHQAVAAAVPPTLKALNAGQSYVLNIYAARSTAASNNQALDADTLLAFLTKNGDFTGVLRKPALVKSNVAGQGYTFSPSGVYDQWLAWVKANRAIQLPAIVTPDGTTPVAVAASAFDATAVLPAGLLPPGTALSGNFYRSQSSIGTRLAGSAGVDIIGVAPARRAGGKRHRGARG